MKFYKHDIVDWFDGTDHLSHGAYRVYHKIIQLIYLHEGPIRYNERGLAGACNMRPDHFKGYFNELLTEGKLTCNDSLVDNYRCANELVKVSYRNANIARGVSKALKNKKAIEVEDKKISPRQDKTRQYKTQEKTKAKEKPAATRRGLSYCPDNWRPSEVDISWAKGKGFTHDQMLDAAEEMRDWSNGSGKKRSNWGSVWRNWLRRKGTGGNLSKRGRMEIINELADEVDFTISEVDGSNGKDGCKPTYTELFEHGEPSTSDASRLIAAINLSPDRD